MKGYVQVYTGNGKGKTTAGIGLSIRAFGAGLKVCIAQFIKKGDYSEIKALEKFYPEITVKQFGLGRFVKGKPAISDIIAAKEGISEIKKLVKEGAFDIFILDEANSAVLCNILSVDEVIEIIDCKPENVEIVITGRSAHDKIIKRADLVTEMKEIKHYYKKGVKARVGIEK